MARRKKGYEKLKDVCKYLLRVKAETTYILPKGEEYNKLDAGDFQKRFVMGNVRLDLKIEHDNAVHGNRDRGAFEGEDPYVGESRRYRGLAVTAEELRCHGDKRKEHPYETVLEDSNPDNLRYWSASLKLLQVHRH